MQEAPARARPPHPVGSAAEAVQPAESIRKFRIVPGEFAGEYGLPTPSLEIAHETSADTYTEKSEPLYAG
ncbi:hypothetical protein [Streptomyces xiaopingdaonensis]|uniref:hypothetical protein n=1 Tax=Streptomyces xiaopingdaonensis TaxID=1565415 RepID=UPI0002E660FD|nr:hypothetical protein [Streptomyces xiaopingdaonensis]